MFTFRLPARVYDLDGKAELMAVDGGFIWRPMTS